MSVKSPPLFPVWLSPPSCPLGVSSKLGEVAVFLPLLLLLWVVEVQVTPVLVFLRDEALLVPSAAHRVSDVSKLVLGRCPLHEFLSCVLVAPVLDPTRGRALRVPSSSLPLFSSPWWPPIHKGGPERTPINQLEDARLSWSIGVTKLRPLLQLLDECSLNEFLSCAR